MGLKQQVNFRAPRLTISQLEWLMKRWGCTQTDAIIVALDRVYQQEKAAADAEAAAQIER